MDGGALTGWSLRNNAWSTGQCILMVITTKTKRQLIFGSEFELYQTE